MKSRRQCGIEVDVIGQIKRNVCSYSFGLAMCSKRGMGRWIKNKKQRSAVEGVRRRWRPRTSGKVTELL